MPGRNCEMTSSEALRLINFEVTSRTLQASDSATWEALYHSAVLELNPPMLVDRILAAEKACQERRKALYNDADASTELQAIADAEENLQVLRRQLITPSLDNEPGHIHPELSVKTVPTRFQEYVKQGFLEGEFVLIGRDGFRIPIRYDARVFPDGGLVARWERLEE
jgi:hypothetical protein